MAEHQTVGRRRFLRRAGLAVGAAWVAPTLVSTPASAQGSDPDSTVVTIPDPGSGSLVYVVGQTTHTVGPPSAVVPVGPDAFQFTFDLLAGLEPPPVLLWFNPVTNTYEPVQGSSAFPNSYVYDATSGALMVIFDATSHPTISQLGG